MFGVFGVFVKLEVCVYVLFVGSDNKNIKENWCWNLCLNLRFVID